MQLLLLDKMQLSVPDCAAVPSTFQAALKLLSTPSTYPVSISVDLESPSPLNLTFASNWHLRYAHV